MDLLQWLRSCLRLVMSARRRWMLRIGGLVALCLLLLTLYARSWADQHLYIDQGDKRELEDSHRDTNHFKTINVISDQKLYLDTSIQYTSTSTRVQQTTDISTSTTSATSTTYATPGGSRVFYNRVPKCGSRGVLGTFRPLAAKLKYRFVESPIYSPHRLVNQTEEAFIREFLLYERPMFYHRHLYFVDFKKYGYEQPIYINVIRDPYDRLVSEFYYLKKFVRRKIPTPPQKRIDMTFDECTRLQHVDCTWTAYTFKEVPFFCGQDPMCRVPSDAAVARAKQNIEQYYTTVGVTEKLGEFFFLLHTVLPQFFKGAHQVFNENEKQLLKKFKTNERISPKPSSRRAMMRHLKYDYDLYKWVLQRFHGQYDSLNATLPR